MATNQEDQDEVKNELFTLLKSNKEDQFINLLSRQSNLRYFITLNDGNSTFLQRSCEKGLTKIVKKLLEEGADVNLVTETNKEPPVEIAALYGNFEIFTILLNHPEISISSQLLCDVIKRSNDGKSGPIDYGKCCEILIRKLQNDGKMSVKAINGKDFLGNTSIRYSIRYADENTTKMLFNLGASLATKNKLGFTPLKYTKPKLLEELLDECVKIPKTEKNDDKQNFKVTFDYKNLVPLEKQIKCGDVESGDKINDESRPDTEVIEYMRHAPEFKDLLKHPVIEAFIYVKWYKISRLFWINFLLYLVFVASLVFYTVYYCIYFKGNHQLLNITWIILFSTFIILILREICQFVISVESYFKKLDNFIELFLIGFTLSLLIIPSSSSSDLKKTLSSITILLAFSDLVLMIGQHPKLSKYVIMLETVSITFFKSLLVYSVLILAFFLSFFVLFTDNVDTKTQTRKNSTTSDDSSENSFNGLRKSFSKTIVMLTGEFDADSIKFEMRAPITQLIFLLFVLLISITLLNLLTGLAVSDTQRIENEAKLVGLVTIIDHICFVEKILLDTNRKNPVKKIIQKVIIYIVKQAKIFQFEDSEDNNNNNNYELCVKPNDKGKIYKGNYECMELEPYYGKSLSELGKGTIERINAIIKKKRLQLDPKSKSESSLLIEFFLNMANTMSTFPKSRQSVIKNELFKLVNSSEMELQSQN